MFVSISELEMLEVSKKAKDKTDIELRSPVRQLVYYHL